MDERRTALRQSLSLIRDDGQPPSQRNQGITNALNLYDRATAAASSYDPTVRDLVVHLALDHTPGSKTVRVPACIRCRTLTANVVVAGTMRYEVEIRTAAAEASGIEYMGCQSCENVVKAAEAALGPICPECRREANWTEVERAR